jgi:hypothetical protein
MHSHDRSCDWGLGGVLRHGAGGYRLQSPTPPQTADRSAERPEEHQAPGAWEWEMGSGFNSNAIINARPKKTTTEHRAPGAGATPERASRRLFFLSSEPRWVLAGPGPARAVVGWTAESNKQQATSNRQCPNAISHRPKHGASEGHRAPQAHKHTNPRFKPALVTPVARHAQCPVPSEWRRF